jgi:hypothetical protein
MKHTPGYGKIMTLGALYTQDALKGEVIIQEKVDGSQFRFGVNEDGDLVCSSKGAHIDLDNPPQLFAAGVEYIKSIRPKLGMDEKYFYGEILDKPRHNTLAYDRTPKNHIVLFDALIESEWVDRATLAVWADQFDVDVIPELYRGEATTDTITGLLQTQSYLGGQIIEGVVIKNYGQKILYAGSEQCLFTKYVREEFKEMHSKNPDWMGGKDKVTALFTEYCTEPRWHKAVQHLREAGQLEQSPRDIGKIIKEVPADIISECEGELKNRVWSLFKGDFVKVVTRGLPQWYKDQLMKSLEGGEGVQIEENLVTQPEEHP